MECLQDVYDFAVLVDGDPVYLGDVRTHALIVYDSFINFSVFHPHEFVVEFIEGYVVRKKEVI